MVLNKHRTHFERHPKVSGRPVPLLKLYANVMSKGGYDEVTAGNMLWRPIARDFQLGPAHEAAMTFQLKTVYYKYLAAYEIATHWNEKPPPPEILENISAKGGNLRGRTLENYQVSGPRESLVPMDHESSSDEESKTPKREPTENEEQPNSGGRYPTRNLRQDPKKTQLYQPDTTPGRQVRNRTSTHSPQPQPHPASSQVKSESNSLPPNISEYMPKPQMPLTLRPVVTPGSNPLQFQNEKARLKPQPRSNILPQHNLKPNLPPGILNGPNIYIRCLYGLRSGVQEEQDFALHHLVKVSHERWEKYKFEGFPLLAETLLEKALQISTLLYGIKWEISYEPGKNSERPTILDGTSGTTDLLDRLLYIQSLPEPDPIQTPDFQERLEKVNEAALVLRNMILLEENARFISQFPLTRDFLVIALSLPRGSLTVEFQNYALDICEQVTKFMDLKAAEPLYKCLVQFLGRDDRGTILGALRSINRIALTLPHANPLLNIPLILIEKLCQYTLLEDDELISLALDFLYQYTAIPENLSEFLTSLNFSIPRALVSRLVTLLFHSAVMHEEKILVDPAVERPPNTVIPRIPDDLFQQMLAFGEPKRSSYWLKSCFEEQRDSEITQIQIWQAYQTRFQNHQHLAAAEFIKNVSNTFSGANAQVIPQPSPPRFIIKGIRPKRRPTNLASQAYRQCLWDNGNDDDRKALNFQPCHEWLLEREHLWQHILTKHWRIPRLDTGQFENLRSSPEFPKSFKCCWPDCTRPAFDNAMDAAVHVRLHLPDDDDPLNTAKSGTDAELLKPAKYMTVQYYQTPVDQNGPTGVSFQAILILRNIARNINRLGKSDPNGTKANWPQKMDGLFGGLKLRLWDVAGKNRILVYLIADLMAMVEKGESDDLEEVEKTGNVAKVGTAEHEML